jgi:hypothetical protein
VRELGRRHQVFRTANRRPWIVISNVLIHDQDDRRATVISSYTSFKQDRGGSLEASVGYYEDSFVLDGDTWRIQRRSVRGGELSEP